AVTPERVDGTLAGPDERGLQVRAIDDRCKHLLVDREVPPFGIQRVRLGDRLSNAKRFRFDRARPKAHEPVTRLELEGRGYRGADRVVRSVRLQCCDVLLVLAHAIHIDRVQVQELSMLARALAYGPAREDPRTIG